MKHSLKHFFWGVPVLPVLALALAALAPAALAPAAFAAATAPPTYAYALTILGSLGGSYSFGTGVNSSGQVTGYSDLGMTDANGNSLYHAFLTGPNGSGLTDLGATGDGTSSSYGYGVNDSGAVVGYVGDNPDALLFFNPPGASLSQYAGYLVPGNRQSAGINASGQVTGNATATVSGHVEAFLSRPNGNPPFYTLGFLPGGNFSEGFGVNASGQVTGDSSAAGGVTHAFLSGPNGGALKDLGTLPGGGSSIGSGVNASGQVAGYAYLAGGDTYHAFLSGPNGGPLQDLGTLSPGTFRSYSQGDAVNDSGQVVGVSDGDHAFLYSNGRMTDLNTLIPPATGNQATFVLNEATSISNNGFITGTGSYFDGAGTYAFLLTPIPVNVGPKITVTATASRADTNGRRTITLTTTNTGGAAADMLTLTSVTLGGAAPASNSPSLLPTTPNNLSNLPGMNTQQNGFYFSPSPGTMRVLLHIVGHYTDPNTGITSSFTPTIRLTLS